MIESYKSANSHGLDTNLIMDDIGTNCPAGSNMIQFPSW